MKDTWRSAKKLAGFRPAFSCLDGACLASYCVASALPSFYV